MKQKTALITGASRGIGRAAAAALAKDGWNLTLNCIQNETLLQALCRELSETYHIQCIFHTGDVSDPEVCRSMFAKTAAAFGGVGLLVNNAGISRMGLLSDMTPEEWNRVIAVNLSSVFYCCRLAIPHMLSAGGGKIINISSVWGTRGASCEAAYSASKAGVNGLTKALAKELAPENIQVNALACGAIDTDMNNCLSEEELAALAEEIPAGRLGTPEEAGEMIRQLANAPAYLTGQIIGLDGGWF